MSEYILDKIIRLSQEIKETESIKEFETIEIPFQLMKTIIQLFSDTLTPEALQDLAKSDSETLDAFALELSDTLNKELELLKIWLPHLSELPIQQMLIERNKEGIHKLSEIVEQKSNLLASATTCLNREKELREEFKELNQLKEKVNELENIEKELETVDLEDLRKTISNQEAELTPRKEELDSLQQEHDQLGEQINSLKQQKNRIQERINLLRSRSNSLETQTEASTSELITLEQTQREKLQKNLDSLLSELEEENLAYQDLYEKLNQAITQLNQYQTKTEELRDHLQKHYQDNAKVANALPIDQEKINYLIETIDNQLTELDQELAQARDIYAQSQEKKLIYFNS